MKKHLIYSILLSYSAYSVCAEPALQVPSLGSRVKGSLASVYRTLQNRWGQAITDKNVTSTDLDKETVMLNLTTPKAIQGLLEDFAAVNQEVAEFGNALQTKIQEFRIDKALLEGQSEELKMAIARKNADTLILQKRIAELEQQVRMKDDFEELTQSQTPDVTEDDSTRFLERYEKQYKAAAQTNLDLQEQLHLLTAQYQHVSEQVKKFSTDFDRSSHANLKLQQDLSSAWEEVELERERCEELLRKANTHMRAIAAERDRALEEKTALIDVLTPLVQAGAASIPQEGDAASTYSRYSARQFLDAIPGINDFTKEKLITILFPAVEGTTELEG